MTSEKTDVGLVETLLLRLMLLKRPEVSIEEVGLLMAADSG